jgi:hypothetical protein
MKKFTMAAVLFGALALTACNRGDEDQLNAADINEMQSLDELSNEAANVAAEAEVLENQAANLNAEAQSTDNATGPETPADENIAGM